MVDKIAGATVIAQTSRRQFGLMGAAAALAGMAKPALAADDNAGTLVRTVSVSMPEGAKSAVFIAPETGKFPGIVMWGKSEKAAKKLASQGWAVLLVDASATDPQQTIRQARACVAWLDTQERVLSASKLETASLGSGYTLRNISAAHPRFSFANGSQRQAAAAAATLFAVPDIMKPVAVDKVLNETARMAMAA